MTWNIFKRIDVLEKKVQEMDRRLNPYAAAPVRSEGKLVFTMSEVEQERERNRQYQRERYAIKKNDKAAREKKNAYARAYYARTKGAKK